MDRQADGSFGAVAVMDRGDVDLDVIDRLEMLRRNDLIRASEGGARSSSCISSTLLPMEAGHSGLWVDMTMQYPFSARSATTSMSSWWLA